MAQPAETFDTYDAVGNREDLQDIIYNIDPTETPFMSNVRQGTASAVYHEWQTDTLAAAAQNAQIQGDDAAGDALTPTTRLGNYSQTSRKVVVTSGTQNVVESAGRGSEQGYQLAKAMKELKRDMEVAFVGLANPRVAGNSTTASELAGFNTWVTSASSRGTSGADPTGDGTDAPTDGTQRAFTESLLEDVIDTLWTNGGDPSMILCNSFQKRQITGFTGNATKYKEVDDRKVINAVDVYVSDYFELLVVPDRHIRSREVYLVDPNMWGVHFLRPVTTERLAKTGDSTKDMIIGEYTLAAYNEKSSGVVADLTTS